MKRSSSSLLLPTKIRRTLVDFGTNIAIARKRRGLTAMMMAERLGVGRDTYARVEKGDPSVALGSFAMALFALGMDAGFARLADPQQDDTGTLLDLNRLPKRVRPKREPQTK